MRGRGVHLVFACVVPLAGCAAVNTTSAPATPALSGNWQIQSGSAITAASTGDMFLQGALQTQGTHVTGTFNGTPICGNEKDLDSAGTLDALGDLSIQASPVPFYNVTLTIPGAAAALANGT